MPSPTGASDPPAAALALAVYRGLGHAFRPFVPLALARRARRGKEDPARTGERYGIASIPRPAGRVVWVHAASVGETNAVMGLVERIVAAGLAVVLTTVTVTSAALAVRRAVAPRSLRTEEGAGRASYPRVLVTSVLLTWLNPHVYLDTVLLLGSVAATHGAERWWFALGAVTGSVLWFAGLGYGARLLRPLFSRPGSWRVLDVLVASTMTVIAVGLLG